MNLILSSFLYEFWFIFECNILFMLVRLARINYCQQRFLFLFDLLFEVLNLSQKLIGSLGTWYYLFNFLINQLGFFDDISEFPIEQSHH